MAGSIDSAGEWSSSLGVNPQSLIKKHKRFEVKQAFGLGDFGSVLGAEDLAKTQTCYRVPDDFDLELSGTIERANDPPPDRLVVYEEAYRIGLCFPISPFIFDLFRFYGIPLYILVPNSFCFVTDFMIIYVIPGSCIEFSDYMCFLLC